jgi:hypothetical protein
MPCVIGRTYIPEPDYSANALPSVPTVNSFLAIRNFLQEIVDLIESPAAALTVPGIIENFTATLSTGGITLRWDREPNSFGYVLYRGTTAVFTDARAIAVVYDGTFHLQEWFDRYGQEQNTVPRYYWINGYNKTHTFGPVAGPLVKVEVS